MSILLHGHHANDDGCPLSFDMDAAARVRQIETVKPEHERPLRLLLLREVDPDEMPEGLREDYAKWQEADAKWREADAKYREAYAKHREDYDKWREDYDKWREAYAKWQEADDKRREAYAKRREAVSQVDWNAWHKKHCGGVAAGVCKWTSEHPSIF